MQIPTYEKSFPIKNGGIFLPDSLAEFRPHPYPISSGNKLVSEMSAKCKFMAPGQTNRTKDVAGRCVALNVAKRRYEIDSVRFIRKSGNIDSHDSRTNDKPLATRMDGA